MALTGTQKTAITLVETNLNAAISAVAAGLQDPAQLSTLVVLRHMRKRLELIKVERAL